MLIKHEGPHKYFQTHYSKSKTLVFRCGLTNCTHFIYEPFIVGKLSICWRCKDTFIITKKSTRNKKMHCENCTRGKERITKSVSDLIDKLLGESEEEKK